MISTIGFLTLFAILCHVVNSNTIRTCSAYYVQRQFEETCQDRMFQSPHLAFYKMEQDGVVTGDDVIQYIERDCRFKRTSYIECAESLVSECGWAEQGAMQDILQKSQDTLCIGQEAATWIHQYVHNGFSMDMSCYYHITNTIRMCNEELTQNDIDPETTSLRMASWIHHLHMEQRLPCSIRVLRGTESPANCTSSWVDQLFYLWVFRENNQPIHYLTEDETRLLLRLKEGHDAFTETLLELANHSA